MTNSYCQPTEADFWFPVAPGVTSLPANPLPTSNPSPLPANAVTVPVGFDESNPDLCELFENILPSGVDPVYPVTVDPAQSVPPYQETVSYDLRVRSLITLEKFNYSLGITTEIFLTVSTGFGQNLTYPESPTVVTKLSTIVETDYQDYQNAFISTWIAITVLSTLEVTPKTLIHCNGAANSQEIFDQMGISTVDPGLARINLDRSKFNGSSARIFAPYDKIKITYPISFFTPETGFSIDFWMYIPYSVSKNTWCLYSFSNVPSMMTGIYLYNYPGNSYYTIYFYVDNVPYSNNITGNLMDSWNHILIEKPAGQYTIYVYINGSYKAGRTFNSASNIWNSTVHSLGGDFSTSTDYAVNGWVSEFRAIDRALVYPSSTSVVPTEPYSPPSNDYYLSVTTSLKATVEFQLLTIITSVTITTKLSISRFVDQFAAVIKYTGNATGGRVINTPGIAPQFINFKSNGSYESYFADKSKGAGYYSRWYSYYPWYYDSNGIQAYGTESFTLGAGLHNANGVTYYAMTFGNTAPAYTDASGTFPVTIYANKDWGYSTIVYNGTGSSASTRIPHGLATAPGLITAMWDGYYYDHGPFWGTVIGNDKYINASANAGYSVSSFSYINFDNTYINFSNNTQLNSTIPMHLFCWTSVPGRTKIGSYVAYGPIDTYIQTDFKPAHVLIRHISSGSSVSWRVYDKALDEVFDPFNSTNSTTNTEVVFGVNGFTVKANSAQNITGVQYMYYAIRGPLQEALLSGENLSLSTANSSTGLLKQSIMNSEALAIELGEQEADIFSYTYLLDGEPSSTVITGEATGNTPAFTSGQTLNVQLGATSADLLGGDIYQNNTSLLLHMNGANNSTTFTDNSPNSFTVTANGNAKISTAQSKFGGASGVFDGNGDNLSIADNAAFEFGGGDFTIEMWAYVTANKGYQALMNKSHAASDASGWILYAETDNTIYFRAGNSGSWSVALSSATIPTLNTWQHYAVTRSGTTWRLFIDGVQKASTTNSLSMTDGTLPLYIGRYPYFPSANSAQDFSGYIDEVRITKGIARYTAAFTPLNRPFFDALPAEDPSFSSVSLLMHMDGANASTSFADSSDSGLSLTANGNAQISTALSKFGGASALFDGTGDFLSRAYDAKFDFVLTDFTIEGWIRPTSWKAGGTRFVSTGGGTVAWNSTTGIHVLFQFDSTGKINLQLSNNTATPVSVVGTASAATNVWSHVAVSVSGSTAYLAVNGVVSSHALATRAKPTTTPQIAVATIPGEAGAVANAFVGNIDELRITKGVARYTANFTPPVGPFPSF